MVAQDFEFEKFHISEAVDLSFKAGCEGCGEYVFERYVRIKE
jgi:hypothetical protein